VRTVEGHQKSRAGTITLVSIAVMEASFSLIALAHFPPDLFHRGFGQRRSFLDGHRDEERPLLDNSDLAGNRLDLDPPLSGRDAQAHPWQDSSLLADRLGHDDPPGRIDGVWMAFLMAGSVP